VLTAKGKKQHIKNDMGHLINEMTVLPQFTLLHPPSLEILTFQLRFLAPRHLILVLVETSYFFLSVYLILRL